MPGTVREMFPGGNTGYGFHSFYEYIIPPTEARRIFIIKGGPGVGKSTFMRKIADEMLARGYDAEFHHCSSDNDSLDGVVFPALGIAMIDGTAPHVVDPKNPGAVDEIIHLGDYWDQAGMADERDEIIRINREVGRLFRRVYGYLQTALIYNNELESYLRDLDGLDVAGLNKVGEEIKSEVFGRTRIRARRAKVRHLFASAITPDGPKNYLDSLVGPLGKRILITGRPGTGRTTIVQKTVDRALDLGFDVEAYHCALDPRRIDHVVIPELSAAVINSSSPHTYPARNGDRLINTDNYLFTNRLERCEADLERLGRAYEDSFKAAFELLSRAKAMHDEMETHYVPHMSFDSISARREATLARILNLASEPIKQTGIK